MPRLLWHSGGELFRRSDTMELVVADAICSHIDPLTLLNIAREIAQKSGGKCYERTHMSSLLKLAASSAVKVVVRSSRGVYLFYGAANPAHFRHCR